MVDKKIEIERGAVLNVELPRERAGRGRRGAGAGGRGPGRAAIPLPEDAEEVYAFRKGVKIFDLGYQLTEAHSKIYSEIPMDHAELVTPTLGLDPSWVDPFFHALNEQLLAGSPFGKTEGATNRRQLKYKSEDLFVDVIVTRDGEEKRSVIGRKDKRPHLGEILTDGAPNATAKDEWQPSGTLKPIKSAEALRVESVAYFRPFDTANTAQFKITEAPSYAAEEKEAHLSNVEAIYLAPKIVPFSQTYSTTGYVTDPATASSYFDGTTLYTRLPVLDPPLGILYRAGQGIPDAPAREILKDRMEQKAADAIEFNYEAHVAFNNSILAPAHLTMILPHFDGLLTVPTFEIFSEGTLAGVIKCKGRTLYLWQRDTGGTFFGTFATLGYDRSGILPLPGV